MKPEDWEAVLERHAAWDKAYECNTPTKQAHEDRGRLIRALRAEKRKNK